MGQPLTASSLSLVGGQSEAERARQLDAAQNAIADANRSAAQMTAGDARAIFAVRVAELLEGGRAAMLTPENRRRLVDLGERIGLRAFDANLVIAIVQDGARRGETAQESIEKSPLSLISVQSRKVSWAQIAGPLIAASAIALGAVLALISWIAGD